MDELTLFNVGGGHIIQILIALSPKEAGAILVELAVGVMAGLHVVDEGLVDASLAALQLHRRLLLKVQILEVDNLVEDVLDGSVLLQD